MRRTACFLSHQERFRFFRCRAPQGVPSCAIHSRMRETSPLRARSGGSASPETPDAETAPRFRTTSSTRPHRPSPETPPDGAAARGVVLGAGRPRDTGPRRGGHREEPEREPSTRLGASPIMSPGASTSTSRGASTTTSPTTSPGLCRARGGITDEGRAGACAPRAPRRSPGSASAGRGRRTW